MEKYSGIVILVLIDVLTQRYSDHKWKNILVQIIIILVMINILTQRFSDHKGKKYSGRKYYYSGADRYFDPKIF